MLSNTSERPSGIKTDSPKELHDCERVSQLRELTVHMAPAVDTYCHKQSPTPCAKVNLNICRFKFGSASPLPFTVTFITRHRHHHWLVQIYICLSSSWVLFCSFGQKRGNTGCRFCYYYVLFEIWWENMASSYISINPPILANPINKRVAISANTRLWLPITLRQLRFLANLSVFSSAWRWSDSNWVVFGCN